MRRLLILALLLCGSLAQAAEPGLYSPACRKGESFARVIQAKDNTGALIDFSGYTAKLQIRRTTDRFLELELTSSAGLAMGGSAGTITWTMTPTQTNALAVGTHLYDLKLTSGVGTVSYLLYGYVVAREGVTQ